MITEEYWTHYVCRNHYPEILIEMHSVCYNEGCIPK
jgi:hypothetical protein